jgi:phage baseplate assembly protein V
MSTPPEYIAAETDRRLATLIQAGTIESVQLGGGSTPARCRVRVGEWVSALLPWQSLGAGAVRHWSPPAVGEQCLIVSPSGEPAGGFVLPGFYADGHGQAPSNSATAVVWKFPDGAAISYDHDTGALTASGIQSASLTSAGTITIDAPTVHVTGDITCDGDVTAGSISLKNHRHGGVQTGGGNTGTPI